MGYTKTQWNEGAAPGISAANLNHLETQYDEAMTETDSKILTHKGDAGAHHNKYTDAEAIAAAKTDATLLNYTQGAKVYHDADQTISNNTWTNLSFNSEQYDTDTIHDNVTNNSRLTCKTAGKYLIIGRVWWEQNNTGHRLMLIRKNGGTIIADFNIDPPSDANNYCMMQICLIENLSVNDYVELRVCQDSGGNLDILTQGNARSPMFEMQRIG